MPEGCGRGLEVGLHQMRWGDIFLQSSRETFLGEIVVEGTVRVGHLADELLIPQILLLECFLEISKLIAIQWRPFTGHYLLPGIIYNVF